MSCQQQFLEKFGGRHPPSKPIIWALSKELETKGALLDEHTRGRPKMNAGFGGEWDTLYKLTVRFAMRAETPVFRANNKIF
jgi:hypothetical protein